jgi:hypothetical protein
MVDLSLEAMRRKDTATCSLAMTLGVVFMFGVCDWSMDECAFAL